MALSLLIVSIYLKQNIRQTSFVIINILKEFIAQSLVLGIAAGTQSDGVVESTHNRDQKEFYDYCTQELTLEKANQKLRKYNNFWNYKRIHSALNYDTPMLYFKKLRNT